LNPNENYNLLEQNWIPVLMTNGEFKRVNIKDALTQAGHIRQISAIASHGRTTQGEANHDRRR